MLLNTSVHVGGQGLTLGPCHVVDPMRMSQSRLSSYCSAPMSAAAVPKFEDALEYDVVLVSPLRGWRAWVVSAVSAACRVLGSPVPGLVCSHLPGRSPLEVPPV